MTGWPLVWVFVGIAVAGLIMVACFAVWLWRKATALLREVGDLLDRVGQMLDLIEDIEPSERSGPAADTEVSSMDRTRQPAT
ncbi:MAG: hypothetical protein QM650_16810 [Microlunatus sp.]